MPKVVFVNEHREVEVKQGTLISDVASELGIAVCREEFAGTGIGDYTVWIKGERGCVSGPTWYERVFKKVKGQRRMANCARVMKDCEVWTQAALASRQSAPRPVAPAARAGDDPSLERFDHENDPGGTAWNPYGHPKAIGLGQREAPKYVPKKKKTAKAKAESSADESAAASEGAASDSAGDTEA